MTCHHYCNNELACPHCVRRFWKWAQNHTQGRPQPRTAHRKRAGNVTFGDGGCGTSLSFYEFAALFLGEDRRPVP